MLFFFFFQLIFFQIAGFILFDGFFIYEFIAGWKVSEIFVDFLLMNSGVHAFTFHGAEQRLQVIDLVIYIAAVSFQGMVFGKAIDQFFEQMRFFPVLKPDPLRFFQTARDCPGLHHCKKRERCRYSLYTLQVR